MKIQFLINKSYLRSLSLLGIQVRLAEVANSKHLVFDIRSLDPDKYSFPYHFHRNAEEIFVILAGKAMLRTPEGFTEVSEGDVIF